MASGVLRAASLPAISPATFHAAIAKAWALKGSRWGVPKRLGLAVSGGGDSMALAHLSRQLITEELSPLLTLKAFVVDHRAREESTEEAHKVAKWLQDLGLDSEILTLQWPDGTTPSKLLGFETQARSLRYQALGRACRNHKIGCLMLGHHQDDNVETVLMRLSRGQLGMGLKGSSEIAQLPECHGIYGVCESGRKMDLKEIYAEKDNPDRGRISPAGLTIDEDMPVADGGVSIIRPLLSFSKTQLLSTCTTNNVPYVSDATNFDVTLTPRNAIRYLLSSERLPRALQAPSVLDLIEKSKDAQRRLVQASDSILATTQILRFNPGTGTLLIRLPLSPSAGTSSTGEENAKGEPQEMQIRALTVRRLIDMVSPHRGNHVQLDQLRGNLSKIFSSGGGPPSPDSPSRKPFTLGGVLFEPVEEAPEATEGGALADASTTWLLWREPFLKSQRKPCTTVALQPHPSSASASTSTLPDRKRLVKGRFSDWHLWDNRYWIRVRGMYAHNKHGPMGPVPLEIRPLEPEDLAPIRKKIALYRRNELKEEIAHEMKPESPGSAKEAKEEGNGSRSPRRESLWDYKTYIPRTPKDFTDRLSELAPGAKLRFTLPVMALADGSREVMALPTLGIRIPDTYRSLTKKGISRVKWEVMYKHIDPEVLRLGRYEMR